MGKLNAKVISLKQYMMVDLLLFMVIMVVFEMINVFAVTSWFADEADGYFTVSVMLLITLLVSVRWNWLAIVFPAIDGAVYCACLSIFMTVQPLTYLIYCIGNTFALLASLLFLFVPKKKIFSKWYFTILYVLLAYAFMLLGRTVVSMFCGWGFTEAFLTVLKGEAFNLVFAAIGMVVLSHIDGLVEDQKDYVIRLKKEAEELARRDEYGEEPIEIDPEALAALREDSLNKKDNGLFK